MYTVLNYIRPFEGNHEADVAPGENEFDTLLSIIDRSRDYIRFKFRFFGKTTFITAVLVTYSKWQFMSCCVPGCDVSSR